MWLRLHNIIDYRESIIILLYSGDAKNPVCNPGSSELYYANSFWEDDIDNTRVKLILNESEIMYIIIG